MHEYRLVASWHIEAPQQQVFDAVSDSLAWPSWWPGAESVVQLEEGSQDGMGSIRRYTWKGRLPYRLAFDALATRIVSPELLEASVSGDLAGVGRWIFSSSGSVTCVRYEWHVRTTKRWMNLVGPMAHTLFARNHHALMHDGAQALARRLGARLLESTHGEKACTPGVPCAHGKERPGLFRCENCIRGSLSGILAGAVATAVQMGLWWVAGMQPLAMLLRDSRLAAAILLGRDVLPPPLTFDWQVMLAASLMHLGLSIIYGLLLMPIAQGLRLGSGVLAGALAGFALYVANMYGFTALFPWFAQSRDWITATAHVAFGLTVVLAYRASTRMKRRP